MYNLKFPREVANPKRFVVRNKKEFLKFINNNISITDIYTDVFNYTEFRQPFMYPNYESAILDRVYFDCDPKIKEGGEWITLTAYENMLKFHEWCVKHNILHFPRLSGTGYDVVIATKPNEQIMNKKNCLYNATMWLCEKLDVKTDPQTIGDIARFYRIDNTFNHKPTARRFCIPLDEDIIYLGEKKIFEIAKKQNFKSNRYGKKYWNIKRFDSHKNKYKDVLPKIDIEIDKKDFAGLSEKIPPCIKRILATKDVGWKERRMVITCLRDNCYLLDETIAILKKYLSKKKFIHCFRDEKQPYYLYKNEKYMFPKQRNLIEIGACPHDEGTFCPQAKWGCLLYGRDKEL